MKFIYAKRLKIALEANIKAAIEQLKSNAVNMGYKPTPEVLTKLISKVTLDKVDYANILIDDNIISIHLQLARDLGIKLDRNLVAEATTFTNLEE